MSGTLADVYFTDVLREMTKLLDKEEAQGRTVSVEVRNRDMLWVWRGSPGFIGYPQVNFAPREIYRFDRETWRPVIWK